MKDILNFIKSFKTSIIVFIMLLIITTSLIFREPDTFDYIMLPFIYMFSGLLFYVNIKEYQLEKIQQIIKELLKWK